MLAARRSESTVRHENRLLIIRVYTLCRDRCRRQRQISHCSEYIPNVRRQFNQLQVLTRATNSASLLTFDIQQEFGSTTSVDPYSPSKDRRNARISSAAKGIAPKSAEHLRSARAVCFRKNATIRCLCSDLLPSYLQHKIGVYVYMYVGEYAGENVRDHFFFFHIRSAVELGSLELQDLHGFRSLLEGLCSRVRSFMSNRAEESSKSSRRLGCFVLIASIVSWTLMWFAEVVICELEPSHCRHPIRGNKAPARLEPSKTREYTDHTHLSTRVTREGVRLLARRLHVRQKPAGTDGLSWKAAGRT